jgi:hypothetical protein
MYGKVVDELEKAKCHKIQLEKRLQQLKMSLELLRQEQ